MQYLPRSDVWGNYPYYLVMFVCGVFAMRAEEVQTQQMLNAVVTCCSLFVVNNAWRRLSVDGRDTRRGPLGTADMR